LAILREEDLLGALGQIEPTKIGAIVYRTVPFKYYNSVNSVAGAIKYGGRFNPPLELAQRICKLENGFGFLYTATSPLTCLYECGHVLRGLAGVAGEFQSIVVEPTILVSFKVEADNVLDLRNPATQELLNLESSALCSLDTRAVLNPRGALTPLQNIGVAVFKSGRFGGILTGSRFADVIPSFCFSFLVEKVRCELQDREGVLGPSRH
jgi:hypothetical protein